MHKNFIIFFPKKGLTNAASGVIIKVQKRDKKSEVKIMFVVDFERVYEEFATYREAEIFCGERGIHCENIYEENE